MGGRGASFQSHVNGGDQIIIGEGGVLGSMEEEKPDPESEIHNKPFLTLKQRKISTRQSTDELTNKELLEPHQRQMASLFDEYNSIYKNVTMNKEVHFKANNEVPGALGWVTTGAQNGKLICNLTLNKRFFQKDKEYISQETEKGISTNNFVSVDKKNYPKYVVTHEMGHVLENGLINKLARASKDYKVVTKRNYENKIRDDIMAIYNKKYKTQESKTHLSDYCYENSAEWFAETFTNLKLSSKPAPIALALKEYLDKNK